MNDILHRRFQMFLRVRAFGSDNATDFPANSAGKKNFDELNEAIGMMEQGTAIQTSGTAKQSTSNKTSARAELARNAPGNQQHGEGFGDG
jgi:hypothetical protein